MEDVRPFFDLLRRGTFLYFWNDDNEQSRILQQRRIFMRKCKYLMTLLLVMVLCFTSIPAYAAEVTETEESTVEDLQATEAVTE